MNDVCDFFPFDEFRRYQKETLNEIQKAHNENIKFFLLEAPTGFGKSAISISLLKYFGDGYIVTSEKVLQQQYMKDFESHGLVEIKGRSNYVCSRDKTKNCESGKNVRTEIINEIHVNENGKATTIYAKDIKTDICKGKKIDNEKYCGCTYLLAKETALKSPMVIMNLAYFLTETSFIQSFKPRKILIIDECHLIQEIIWNFASLEISEKFLFNIIEEKMPDFDNIEKYVEWMKMCIPKLKVRVKKIKDEDEKDVLKFKDGELKEKYLRKLEIIESKINSYITKMQTIVDYVNNSVWIFETILNNKKEKKLIFKPVEVQQIVRDKILNYGDFIVLMSATIMNANNNKSFVKDIGIENQNYRIARVNSTIPKENRIIKYNPSIGHMRKDKIDETLPKIALEVSKILNFHNNQKGYIFTNSYKISNYLIKEVKTNRFVYHDDANGRIDALNNHIVSKENTVLITPSMNIGIDLKDELSRFQIIVKMPFPYLGDKQIKKKMEINKEWYLWKTLVELIQAIGRSIRSDSDYATTYILDKDWDMVYARSKMIMPNWFKESITKI